MAKKRIPAQELVSGDVVLLKLGDKFPADCGLSEVHNLQAGKVPLTGQPVPIEK